MAEFQYSARDTEGNRLTGRIEAGNKDAAMKLLSERYELVTQLDELQPRVPLFGGRVKTEDLLTFTQALAAMVESGMALKRAMDVLYEDTESTVLRRVIAELSSDLSAGKSMSAAMSAHPVVFDRFYVSMVRAGESAGKLPELLTRLGEYIERTEAMREKVRSAMVYPTIVLVFALLMVSLIVIFGVPYLEDLYSGLGFQLPLATRVVVLVGGALASNLPLLVLTLLGLGVLLRYFLATPGGMAVSDRLKLQLPLFSDVFELLYTARFARTMATLYASGISLLESLDMVAESVGNGFVAQSLTTVRERVEGGESFSSCLRGIPHFSRMTAGMVSAGEESGNLDRMLTKLADFYEMKLYSALSALASTVEPVLMIAVGICIGGLIIVMGLPFMNLSSLMTG